MSDDRGISPVVGNRTPIITKTRLGWCIGAVVAGMTCWAFWRNANPPDEPVKEPLPKQMAATVPYVPIMPVAPPAPAPQPPPLPKAESPPAFQPVAAQTPLYMPRREPVSQIVPQQITPPPVIKPNMLSFAVPAPQPRQDGQQDGAHQGGTPSAIAYAASHINGVQAGLIGDQTFLLQPGLMPCILDTALDSTLSGPIQCHVPFDIRPHGVTLLGRNSIVHGFYEGSVHTGQARIMVNADYVSDPSTGCFISLGNAGLADTVGRSGLDGNVDNHWTEKFGGAVLLTIAESALGILNSAVSKGGNSYVSLSAGGSGVGGLAEEMLRSTINIPPTITKDQGSPIAVFIQKTLDFSPCYDLKIKDNH